MLQVSLQQGFDPLLHFKSGQTLQILRDEGVLIIGGGGVTHNQAEFRRGYLSGADLNIVTRWSQAFDAWVTDILINRTGQERTAALLDFKFNEFYPLAHPTIEHFLPLIVAMGAVDRISIDSRIIKLHSGFQYSLSTSAF